MKEKGFTLIELLAVIVILAIIALIATPIIIGIINDAKNQSAERSAELYLKGAELAIARKNLTTEFGDATCSVVTATGNLSCTTSDNNNIDVEVEMDGEKPTSGTIVFSSGKITSVTNLQTSGKTFETNSSGKLVIVGSSSSDTDNNSSEQGGNTENPGDNQGQENTGGEDTNTQTMYYTYDLSGTVGSTAAPANPSTTPPTGKNAYIGYSISNGVVSEAYACFIRNSKEYCLKGNDTNAYRDNRDIIKEAFADVVGTSSCSFGDEESNCDIAGLTALIYSSGYVSAYCDGVDCHVDADGYFKCR